LHHRAKLLLAVKRVPSTIPIISIARPREHACRHACCPDCHLAQLLKSVGSLRDLCGQCAKLRMLTPHHCLYLRFDWHT